MKKNSFKISVKRIVGSLLVSMFVFISAASAQTPVSAAFRENTANIKFVGADNDSYVFNVAYNKENGDKFLLRILDARGDVLFAGTYSDKKFDKRFRLVKDGNDKLNFEIKNLKDNSIQTFEIITTTQLVEDVVVRKVI